VSPLDESAPLRGGRLWVETAGLSADGIDAQHGQRRVIQLRIYLSQGTETVERIRTTGYLNIMGLTCVFRAPHPRILVDSR
jgi:hypothetical protein